MSDSDPTERDHGAEPVGPDAAGPNTEGLNTEPPVADALEPDGTVADALEPDAGANAPADAAGSGVPAESAPPRDVNVGDAVGLSDAEATIADLDVPEPEIPDAEIPAAALAEPVIPPPVIPDAPEGLAPALPDPALPAAAGDGSTVSDADAPLPATRAERRSIADTPPVVAPPPDPAVVPPASGATPSDYRGWTIAIFSILIILLVGAVVLVAALLAGGVTPFPTAASVPATGAMLDAGSEMLLRGAS